MKPFTDTDLIDYLQCPARWNAKRSGKYNYPEQPLCHEYFNLYAYESPDFPQWQVDNAKSIFYSSGGMQRDFKQASAAVDRLMADDYIRDLLDDVETVKIETDVYDIPVSFDIPGVSLEKQFFIKIVLGPSSLSSKKPYSGNSGPVQWVNWMLADMYPPLMFFYSEALYSQFCISFDPLLAVVEKNLVPNYNLYGLEESASFEKYNVKKALQDMMSFLSGNTHGYPLVRCNHCDYCRTSKKITSPEPFNYQL